MTPVRAYAALRARAPGRTSYLVEQTEPDERGQQRSVIGFLAKREAASPPAVDALREVAKGAIEMPARSEVAEIAEATCADAVSLVLFDAALAARGAQPFTEQPFVGREIRDVASLVFDHVAGTITLAATNVNVVERCARVLAEAPELAAVPEAGGPADEFVNEAPPAADFTKQLTRAGRRLAIGGIDRLMLGRSFAAPARGADALDVLRALREAAPARFHFFVELAHSPMFAGYAAAGSGREIVRFEPSTDVDARAKELLELLPVEASCGAPSKDALPAWREVAVPIGARGGLVARVRPGGAIDVLRVETAIALTEGQLHAYGLAEVVPGRDVKDHTAAAREEAHAALLAIRRAQDAAAAREAAAASS